ncbi:hypothetical protein, partial [Piscinibacter sp.]|uniref:hypothetical protein n=1 Tax=Piscinibacter sp. TaxID=1903157 RepID=UPI003782DB5C
LVFGLGDVVEHLEAAGALDLGVELLAIVDKLPAAAAHDRELVDAWAAAIGMTGWYTWIPYKP